MANSAAYQESARVKAPPPSRPRTGKTVLCSVCGKPHYRKKYILDKAKSDSRFYCARACQHAESARVELICATCGNSYSRFRSQGVRGRRTFCSRECLANVDLGSVRCSWPGCAEMMPCRMMRGTGRNGGDEYKVNRVKKGDYTKYAFCASHRSFVQAHLGDRARYTIGRSQVLSDPTREYGVRALSSRFTRLVLFERAACKCQSCSKPLAWSGAWEIDHVVPVFKGGKTSFGNLQILCLSCHGTKSASEKSESTKERHSLTRVGRWLTHHQKDLIIERLRARLVALGAPID